MQRITLTIPVGDFLPGDGYRVYGSFDALGRCVADVDYTRPIGDPRPRPFWPGVPIGPGFAEGTYAGEEYLSAPGGPTPDRTVITPPLYCGRYRFAVKTVDAIGNVSAGTPAEFAVWVSSGPGPVRNFRQSGVAADGRPVFSFAAPVVMED